MAIRDQFPGNMRAVTQPDLGLHFERAARQRPKSDMEQTLEGFSSFMQKLFIPINILFHVNHPDGSPYTKRDLDNAMIASGWKNEFEPDPGLTDPWKPIPDDALKIVVRREGEQIAGLTGKWDRTQNGGGNGGGNSSQPERGAPSFGALFPAPGSNRG